MFYDAKNGKISIADTQMDYITFGRGRKNMIIIPGMGDGLKNVSGLAVPYALLCKKLAKKYKVYVFSRRNIMPETFTTKDMAQDVYYAMNRLNIHEAYVMGISQGGMIAQHLALDYPQAVEKLILTVTISKQNKIMNNVIRRWIQMAEAKDYKAIIIDLAKRSYTRMHIKAALCMYTLLGNIGEPSNYQRFLTMARACLTHNTYDRLDKIQCPTLIIGGREDGIVSCRASEEIAERIPNSKMYIYKHLGHGLYQETADFLPRVIQFCK